MADSSSARARAGWTSLSAALLCGILAGALLNGAEASGFPGAGDFGNYFGLWILLVTVIAGWSGSWQAAVLRAVLFLLGMVVTYYLSTFLRHGYLLAHLLLGWTTVTLVLGPPFGALVWYGRKEGWRPAMAAALPVGLLLYEAYSLRFVLQWHAVQFAFDLAAAILLALVLPAGRTQRVRMVVFIPIILLGAKVVNEYILPVVAGLWV